jgi:hypothetical protein
VYIEGLFSWPADVEGKRVRASGTLKEKKYIPDSGEGPYSQGAKGLQTVLENARWEVLP